MAMCLSSHAPSSLRRASSVAATTGPMPGIEVRVSARRAKPESSSMRRAFSATSPAGHEPGRAGPAPSHPVAPRRRRPGKRPDPGAARGASRGPGSSPAATMGGPSLADPLRRRAPHRLEKPPPSFSLGPPRSPAPAQSAHRTGAGSIKLRLALGRRPPAAAVQITGPGPWPPIPPTGWPRGHPPISAGGGPAIGGRPRDIEHRPTKVDHPRTNDPVERLNRTVEEATIRRHHDAHQDQHRTHLRDFLDASFVRRPETLGGLAAREPIRKLRASGPERFRLDPTHQPPGPSDENRKKGARAVVLPRHPRHVPLGGAGEHADRGVHDRPHRHPARRGPAR